MKTYINKTSALLLVVGILLSAQLLAGGFAEKNRKIIYLHESGSGVESKHAAIKLDTPNSLEGGCFEDIIIFDAATPEGKATYKQLEALQASNAAIKSISYDRDDEGDCHLVNLEK